MGPFSGEDVMVAATASRKVAKKVTKKKVAPLSQEERDARLQEAHDTMAKEVANLRSSADWKRWLDTASKFHKYSFNNILLMMAQTHERGMAEITYVAGFRRWLELNRGVRKGEKGLKIFAPVMVKIKPGEEGFDPANPSRQKLVGFRLTSVFDVQQTDGEPLAERPVFQQPEGEVPEGFHAALDAYAAKIGYPVETGDTGEAWGFTDPVAKIIRLSDRLVGLDAQAAGTKIHEIAHALLHVDGDFDYRAHRGVAETEAESVAYLVGTYFGVDMKDESFHYVAGWAPSLETVQNVGQRVMKTANLIIAAVEAANQKEN